MGKGSGGCGRETLVLDNSFKSHRDYLTKKDVEFYIPDRAEIMFLTITGSHAYGLNRPDSDLDTRGVYLEPLTNILSLNKTNETIEIDSPDLTLYELRKFIYLISKNNPNIIEQLFIKPYYINSLVKPLFDNRQQFISKRIFNTYLGYATTQLNHLKNGTRGVKNKTDLKLQKFNLHIYRLLDQASQLATTKEMDIKVDEKILESSNLSLEKQIPILEKKIKDLQNLSIKSNLPDYPDEDLLNEILIDIRLAIHSRN